MGMNRYGARTFTLEIVAILLAIVFLIPFYFLVGNSLKPFAEILLDSAALPKKLNWDNYTKAWEIMKYPRAFGNSLLITVTSIAGLVWISSMAAYRMVRRPTKYNQILFLLFVAAMVIPFQSIMIPLMRVANWFNLMGSMPGLWFAYLGFGSSLTIFLYHGFVKSIPQEIEESAVVDGRHDD